MKKFNVYPLGSNTFYIAEHPNATHIYETDILDRNVVKTICEAFNKLTRIYNIDWEKE